MATNTFDLSRAERNALRQAQGKSTIGAVASTPVTATVQNRSGGTTTYTANQNNNQQPIVPVAQPLQYDPTKDIQALAEARKQSQLAGLQNKLNQSISGINEQRAVLPQQYTDLKNKASAQNKIGAKSFAEFLARRGLSRSGESAQARLLQNMSLQGELGSLNRQQQNQLDSLSRYEQQLRDTYNNDVNMANSGIESDAMQQLIDARQRQSELARADEIRKQDLALDQERYDYTKSLQQQDQYRQSIAGLGNEMDYAQEILNVQNDNDPTNDWKIPYLQQERNKKVQAIEQASTNYANNLVKQAQDRFNTLGYVASQQDADLLGLPVGTTTQDYLTNQAQINNINNQISNRNLQTQYDINKPYSTSTSSANKNQEIADEIRAIQTYPVQDAINLLKDKQTDLIAKYGPAGYKSIWNDSLNKAIRMGQALPYDEYYSNQ